MEEKGTGVKKDIGDCLFAQMRDNGLTHSYCHSFARSVRHSFILTFSQLASQPASQSCATYLLGTFIRCQHRANSHFFRVFSTFGLMDQNVVPGGGGYVYAFQNLEKRLFQKCMGLGGGGRWSQFCAQHCKRDNTQGTGNAPEITHYSESDSLSSLPLSTRAGTPLGHTSPCL